MEGKKPLVIGVGGLLEQEESGRVQELLGELQKAGCVIYSVRFNTICRDGNTIVCPISDEWIHNFDTTAQTAMADSRVDTSRIGIVASSIGATITDYALGRSPILANGLGPYVAISPFAKPNQQAIKGIGYFMKSGSDLEVSLPHDRARGVRRVIPNANLGYLATIDTNKELERRSRAYHIVPLTILGQKDDRCDLEATRQRHYILEGKPKHLLEYDAGHSVSAELTQKPILEFMGAQLRLD